jgi:glycosyltransferase involved in cell wall biosynthesis
MRVLAIVPAFNEEENLSALLAELRQVNVDSVILDAPS